MPKMPKFETDEELAEWIDTHDTSEFLDELEDVEETFVVKRTPFPKSSTPNNNDAPADNR
jgi:hypothetical protein